MELFPMPFLHNFCGGRKIARVFCRGSLKAKFLIFLTFMIFSLDIMLRRSQLERIYIYFSLSLSLYLSLPPPPPPRPTSSLPFPSTSAFEKTINLSKGGVPAPAEHQEEKEKEEGEEVDEIDYSDTERRERAKQKKKAKKKKKSMKSTTRTLNLAFFSVCLYLAYTKAAVYWV